MKNKHKAMKAIDLYEKRDVIDSPIYQRGEVWNEEKRRTLIDSMLSGMDIPKLYMFDNKNDRLDIVDGKQRILSVWDFFDNELTDLHDRHYSDLNDKEKYVIDNYEFMITMIQNATMAELGELFLRLQLGTPTNSGEKLNSILGNMRTFIIDLTKTPFMLNIGLAKRRFAKQVVCAQIFNNSGRELYDEDKMLKTFINGSYDDLKTMYREKSKFSNKSSDAKHVLKIFDILNDIFGSEAKTLKTKTSVISIYFLVENLLFKNEINKKLIKNFYLQFLEELKIEIKLGVDANRKSLVRYYSKVMQGADKAGSIKTRHDMLMKFFYAYEKTGKIASEI